jgi:membrane associated rhomboid family serine protease
VTQPPKPLDPPMVPFAITGIALWIIAALVMLPFRDELAAHGHGDWFRIAIYGAIWGIPGGLTMVVHDRNRRRRRARAASDSFKTDAPAAP